MERIPGRYLSSDKLLGPPRAWFNVLAFTLGLAAWVHSNGHIKLVMLFNLCLSYILAVVNSLFMIPLNKQGMVPSKKQTNKQTYHSYNGQFY